MLEKQSSSRGCTRMAISAKSSPTPGKTPKKPKPAPGKKSESAQLKRSLYEVFSLIILSSLLIFAFFSSRLSQVIIFETRIRSQWGLNALGLKFELSTIWFLVAVNLNAHTFNFFYHNFLLCISALPPLYPSTRTAHPCPGTKSRKGSGYSLSTRL